MSKLEIGQYNETEGLSQPIIGSGKGRRKFFTKLAWVLGGLAVASIVGIWAGGKLGLISSS